MNKRHIKIGSLRSPRQRRQRTTSINLTKTIDATESIIRANNRTIYTAGRPPWYDCAGQQVEPFVIGLFSFVWFICTKQKKQKNTKITIIIILSSFILSIPFCNPFISSHKSNHPIQIAINIQDKSKTKAYPKINACILHFVYYMTCVLQQMVSKPNS